MEETTQNVNAAPSSVPSSAPETSSNANVFDEKSGAGPIIGIIIVVVLLIIGGVYYYMSMQSSTGDLKTSTQEQSAAGTAENIATAPDAATQALQVQSNSTNVSDIEADLNNTNLNSLSTDLPALEASAAQ